MTFKRAVAAATLAASMLTAGMTSAMADQSDKESKSNAVSKTVIANRGDNNNIAGADLLMGTGNIAGSGHTVGLEAVKAPQVSQTFTIANGNPTGGRSLYLYGCPTCSPALPTTIAPQARQTFTASFPSGTGSVRIGVFGANAGPPVGLEVQVTSTGAVSCLLQNNLTCEINGSEISITGGNQPPVSGM
ncbi:hypothetical protein ACFV16_39525 [Streptomyces massasporeus]|uniref:hypothetical protein n=1 Tax=Streptomyces massasporeus TaxID=67324 RepID=UPI0036CB92DE